MIGTRKLGKPNSEKFRSDHLRKIHQKKLQAQKTRTRQKLTQLQRKMKWLKQPQLKILKRIKHPPTLSHHSIWTPDIQYFDSTAYIKPSQNPQFTAYCRCI